MWGKSSPPIGRGTAPTESGQSRWLVDLDIFRAKKIAERPLNKKFFIKLWCMVYVGLLRVATIYDAEWSNV